jgi:hypothetical protein
MKKFILFCLLTLVTSWNAQASSADSPITSEIATKPWSYVCTWDKLNSFIPDSGAARIQNEKKRVRAELDFAKQTLKLTDLLQNVEIELSGDVRKIPTYGAAALYSNVALSNDDKDKIFLIFMSSLQRRLTPLIQSDSTVIKSIRLMQLRDTVEQFSLSVYADIRNSRGQFLQDRPVASLYCYNQLP